MNAHQRRVSARKLRREEERAFSHFRRAGIPSEQARHWAEARAQAMSENYDPERPTNMLYWIRQCGLGVMVAALVAAVVGMLLVVF